MVWLVGILRNVRDMGWIDQTEDGQCDGHVMWQAGQDDYVPLFWLMSSIRSEKRRTRRSDQCGTHVGGLVGGCPREHETQRRESHGNDGTKMRMGMRWGVR